MLVKADRVSSCNEGGKQNFTAPSGFLSPSSPGKSPIPGTGSSSIEICHESFKRQRPPQTFPNTLEEKKKAAVKRTEAFSLPPALSGSEEEPLPR